jgi:hypothetical protein
MNLNLGLGFEGILKGLADYIVEAVSQRLAAMMGANNNIIQQPILYTNQEACKYLNVCTKTLQNYRDGGMIEFSQTGRKIYYTQDNLNAFLAKNKMEAFNADNYLTKNKKEVENYARA